MTLWERIRAHTNGGAHVPHHKHTAEQETVVMPPPEKIVLPMVQHIGAPCMPTVKVGDEVAIGQVVGDSGQAVSAPIHSGIAGTVTAMPMLELPGGRTVQALEITSDGSGRIHESVKPPEVNTREDFLQAVRNSGLVGLGGAGFPAHIKLNPPNVDAIDTLVINAAECEPYITADYRECMENSWDIVSGIQTVMEFLAVRQVIIAIERNKPADIRTLSEIARSVSTPERKVRVKGLPARYPQGAEKVLVAATTGRRIPMGKLPSDVGCIVMNVTSIAVLSRYLKTGMPLVQRRVTVDGSAIAKPQNLQVTIGTSIQDVVAFCGGYSAPVGKLLMGGPMMGLALNNDELPVLKQNNAILALAEEDVKPQPITACIRCGRCAAACPMQLMPTDIARAYNAGEIDTLKELDAINCMECGCCTFACPAHRPIVQTMRMAKDALRRASIK